jgi:hypothetical protein
MTAVAFDTLKLARKLRDSAEMSQVQAEGVADALAEAMSGAELATKSDLAAVETALKRDIRELEVKVDARFNELVKEIHGRFKEIDSGFRIVLERIDRRAAESEAKAEAYKNTLLRWLLAFAGTAFVIIIGTAVAVIRYLPPGLHN